MEDGIEERKAFDLAKLPIALLSGSTKQRGTWLINLRQYIESSELPQDLALPVADLLFRTYPYYIDRDSRRAVQACFVAFLANPYYVSITPKVVKIYCTEASKESVAAANAFVLVELGSIFLPRAWQQYGQQLSLAFARVLDLCVATAKGTIRHSAIIVARRAIREIGKDKVPTLIVWLSAKDQPLGNRTATLLGTIASVCARDDKTDLLKAKNQFYDFYIREILGSRFIVPGHITRSFSEFFSNFTTFDDLGKEVVPAFEKALLRAPEVSLRLLAPLVFSLSDSIDVAKYLAENFLQLLVSNAHSKDVNIRNQALSAFAALVERSREAAFLENVAEEISTRILKATAVDQRIIYARMLAILPYSLSGPQAVIVALCQTSSKEPNENALEIEVSALVAHFIQTISISQRDTKATKAFSDALTKGLNDKKPAVRKSWALGVAELLWQLIEGDKEQYRVVSRGVAHHKRFKHQSNGTKRTNGSRDYVTESMAAISGILGRVMPQLMQIFDEVIRLPFAAGPMAAAAFAITAVAHILSDGISDGQVKAMACKARIHENALSTLFNPRVYSKLNADDLRWVVRSLTSCAKDFPRLAASSAAVASSWSQAFIYIIIANGLPVSIQQEAKFALTDVYLSQKHLISDLIIEGLWEWHKCLSNLEKDTAAIAAKSGASKLYLVVRSISIAAPGTNQEEMRQQLINMLVLCRPELLPRVHWIDTCLRMRQDPGRIAQEHTMECLDKVEKCLKPSDNYIPSASIELASYNTAAELAFVSPDTIVPLLIKRIETALDSYQVEGCGPTEIAIARTPEGTAFVDVLSSKGGGYSIDKNSKDYDVMKWEEEMRYQIAQKKGQERKLTAEERSKVNAQLQKEVIIRKEVQGLEKTIRDGVGIIQALAVGPPTDASLWLGSALKALTSIIVVGVGRLVGSIADKAFLACSSFVTLRLGSSRKFIGIATLRALGSTTLPAELVEERLGDLVTRLLYRLRSASDQRPLDSVSLLYILPLLLEILRQGGVDQRKTDEADEQITLALEILSYHTDAFVETRLPRTEVLKVLIETMQRYTQHYKLTKDCLSDICRAIGDGASEDEVAILLKGIIVPQPSVRMAVLQSVREYIDLTDSEFVEEVWLACHDDLDENVDLGQAIWSENALEIDAGQAIKLLPYLASKDKQLRCASSRALAEAVGQDQEVFDQVLDQLENEYRILAKPRVPERDTFGMLKKIDLSDPWENRSGIALAFKAMSPNFPASKLLPFTDFLIKDRTVGDRDSTVRDEMIDSAVTLIGLHGNIILEQLMQMFEAALDESDAKSDSSDLVSEAIVILYGALAGHLQDGDERVPKVVLRLLSTLDTPSETVQYAVAECLPSLIRTSGQKISEFLQVVLNKLLQSKRYASRRGAAYGLAGIVKGEGISALREHRIMSTLRTAIENKKDQNHRQGALFAYELLALLNGRTFEPYIIQIVPQLLASFGDATAGVREACLDTAKACFSSLSSYGVKIILPTLLQGLEESQWRSKKGACDLLGAMAYLDPQQLALSLPDIIPSLTSVLNDSHKEVRTSANRSLQRFGEVISNPEVKSLVNILLKALSDPTKYTEEALDALIKVSFVHYLDAPSLALIVRILERALGERSASKRKSAQIIGSLAHLTERKDVIPHLPVLVAGLKSAIVDPVPATRATASKALGSLVEKLGEDALPDLIPSLMTTLRADSGAGDRLGSAQALSEVLAGLGKGRLEETLPTILQNVASSKPTVREGFMSLFIYLPACFGNSFASYLNRIIPPILSGLADEVESIRETSLRAGRLLVKNFATKAIDLLLPELDRGLADDSYRIRLSSVELVGDLLFNLTGISGKTEQDDDFEGAAGVGQSLLEALGEEKRNKILSSLYICRCDTSGLVRSAAVNVWKALVATPRTLKELIPTLTQLLIRRLASSNMEQKVIAGNALGELIRKAGEGVLASLLPTLEESLQTSTDSDTKQGICIALREIISSASPEALEDYEKTLISVVRVALVDADDDVREVAAEAFDSLQQILGKRAVDQVLPYLLDLLRQEEQADTALSALLTLLTDNTRSNIILPNLVPTLLVRPISSFNARAIASLSQVARPAMTRRLPAILNTLMDNIVGCTDDRLRSDLENSFDAIMLSVDEFDGLNTAMSVMLALVKNTDHRRRAAANVRLSNFFAKTEIGFARYHQDLIRVCLISFDDSDSDVVKSAWLALSELTKRLKKEEMETLVLSTRQILQQVGVPGATLPGFLLPKGISAVLPIFLQGLMNGTADQRTNAALAISDIVDRINADSLKPFVTQITGPLIRVVSERSVDVKSAIMLTLNNLLEKIPLFLKPFLPQLQRTFAKSLADPTSEVLRSRAAKALGTLITLTPRIDPLIAELVTGSKTPDLGVQNAMLKALYEVISKSGTNMSETSRGSILGLIDNDTSNADDSIVITYARLLGALMKSLPPSFDSSSLIKTRVLTSHMSPLTVLNLNSVLLESPSTLTENYAQQTTSIICQGIRNKNTFFSDNCVLAAGKFLLIPKKAPNVDQSKFLLEALAVATTNDSIDTKRLALVVIRTVSRNDLELISAHLPILAPPVYKNVRSMVIPVKLAAEAAFLSIFSVVESEREVFDRYMAEEGSNMETDMKRSMPMYFDRVARKQGIQARERKEAEGGQGGLGLSNDEREDEREIWSVGKVDLEENASNDE